MGVKVEKFIVKKVLATYQTGKNGKIRPVMLMNELQAIADMHARILGAGREFCMEKKIGWVVTHYIVDILELPDDKEELSFITWPTRHEALKAVRDFEVRGADGRLMITAASQWILIDMTTRRPIRLTDVMEHWDCIPERALDREFEKFPDFESESAKEFDVRYDDIDVNRHVNNTVYTTWATESLGQEFLSGHKLREIRINFKKEIPDGTPKVSVGYSIDGNTTRHIITSGDAANAIVVCDWL